MQPKEANIKNDQLYVLDFSTAACSFSEAAQRLRSTTSGITPFRHSLLGALPLCADDIELDVSRHQALRDFSDEAGLVRFKAYLAETVARSRSLGFEQQPVITDLGKDKSGFVYVLASGHGEIRIFKRDDGWYIKGKAQYRYRPDNLYRKLTGFGFTVRTHRQFIPHPKP